MLKQVQKIASSLLISSFLLGVLTNPVAAFNVPGFPSCVNPQGTQIASYATGIHGIVGSPEDHTGADSVYQIDSETLMQCFCPENGSGIQTNWLKATSFSQDDIDQFKKMGWVFVPSGAAWGLTDDPYMALNSDFSCKSTGNGGGGGSGGASSNSESGSSQGGVISSLGQVLGLAFTGNNYLFYSLPVLGLAFLSLGLILRKLK